MKLFFWSIILLLIFSIYLTVGSFDDVRVQEKGTIVKMRIEELPLSCLETRTSQYATFSYANEFFVKQIDAQFCNEHHVGELVDMKYLAGNPLILLPGESAKSQLQSALALVIVSCMIGFFYWRKIQGLRK
jgi:hypothetical protein